MTRCTAEHHAHLQAHEWHRMIPIGSMAGVESANCPDCPEGQRFTYSRPLPVSKFWTNHRHDVLRIERTDGHQEVVDADDEDVAGLLDAVLAGDADERWQGEDATRDDAIEAANAAYDALHGEAA